VFNWQTKETNVSRSHGRGPELKSLGVRDAGAALDPPGPCVCVECLIGKQKKPILFKVTEPSSIPYRTHSACAKRAAYPDPPPVIPLPESIAAQAVYQLRYNCHGVECLIGKL